MDHFYRRFFSHSFKRYLHENLNIKIRSKYVSKLNYLKTRNPNKNVSSQRAKTFKNSINKTKDCNLDFLQKLIHYIYVLRDLVSLLQFKKREKYPWRSIPFSYIAGSDLPYY